MVSKPRVAAIVVLACGGVLLAGAGESLRAYRMAGTSMEHTLAAGDYILVRPMWDGRIERGEVVQMLYPVNPSETWIKRVAAVPGDRLRFHDKALILNGTPADDPYVIHSTAYIDPFRDNFPDAPPPGHLPAGWSEELARHVVNGELVVPAGKYFVLGDNRDDSLDSRYFGFVDRSYIVGKPVVRYFSKTPGGAVRWQRIFRGI